MEIESLKAVVWKHVGGMVANIGVSGTVLGLSWVEVGNILLKAGQVGVVVVSIVVGILQWRKLRLEIKRLKNEQK